MSSVDLRTLLAKIADPRQAHELLAAAMHEFRMRIEREKQARPGGLLEFVRYFWDTIEPGREFVEGWALEAIAMHLEAVTYGGITRLLINVPPGSMKAIDVETPVLTTQGWKQHGDLCIGDFIYGPDGQPKRVQARTPNKVDKCYEVTFDDGTVIVAGEGHLWEVERDTPNQNKEKRGGWKRIYKIVTTPELKYPKSESGRRCADRISVARPFQRPLSKLPIDPYIFGAWLGDGDSRQAVISCGDEDYHHFRQFGREVSPSGTVNRISLDIPKSTLVSMDVFNNKHIPEIYLLSSESQRWSLIQGLMDTDGQASPEGWCRFTSGRQRLVENFVTLAASLGLKPRVGAPFMAKGSAKKRGPYWRVRFTPPAGAKIFQLWRKQSRLSNKEHKGINHRFITDVREIEPRLVNCIQVDGGLYTVTDRFITTHNSLMTNVFWPAWQWSAAGEPGKRFINFSYSSLLTERDNQRMLDLIESQKFQDLWGHKFTMRQKGVTKISNNKFGWKFASSVRGTGTGERADVVILDDPHNIKEGESQTIREETVRWFREAMSNRLNHMTKSAIICIMQRVHESDVSGTIITEDLGYDHLMIPMLYEDGRHCVTSIGWSDPRSIDGENFWIERFPPAAVEECLKLGDHAFAAQYQQRPSPRGGGIFKNEYWNVWEPDDGKYPTFDFILASVDPAYTHHDENDPSAMTVWGLNYADDGTPRVFLIAAWRKWLQLHGPDLIQEWGEPPELFLERQKKAWGLVEWIGHTCKRFHVDRLLVEAKASGISVVQELQRLLFQEKFGIEFVNPGRADKEVRANRVQHIWSANMVYRPERPWATMVEDEMAAFPKARYDDLTDSATQALWWFRQHGMLSRREELKAANDPETGGSPARDDIPLYPM